MKAIPRKLRQGSERFEGFIPAVTSEEIWTATEEGEGFSVRCGKTQGCCEPDARKYLCESCGQNSVYGLEDLAVRGMIQIEGGKS